MLTNYRQEGSCTKKKTIVWGKVQKHQYICTNLYMQSPMSQMHGMCCTFCWQVRNMELREFAYLIATKLAPSL